MNRRWLYLIIVLLIAAALWASSATIRPAATVDVIRPITATIQAYVEEQAVTELPTDYLIAMPISGWLQRDRSARGRHRQERTRSSPRWRRTTRRPRPPGRAAHRRPRNRHQEDRRQPARAQHARPGQGDREGPG